MIKNYFKTAWRNLTKNKAHSFINIAGLTIGLTCCLLIALYIQHELSFDKFEEKGNRIARVIMRYNFDGIAILIAIPAAWWASAKWLERFSYRTAVSWNVFVIAALATILLAIITVSFQAIKAAIANPVKSLRTE